MRLTLKSTLDYIDGIQLSNDIKITLNLYDAAIVFTSFIKILEDRFATFLIGDILNIYCWLATIPAPALDIHGMRLKGIDTSATITNLAISLSQLKLEVECISCSSHGISELAELLSTPKAASKLNISANQLIKDTIDELIFGSSFAPSRLLYFRCYRYCILCSTNRSRICRLLFLDLFFALLVDFPWDSLNLVICLPFLLSIALPFLRTLSTEFLISS